MDFGFTLELSDKDLLDTHLDLLSPDNFTDIPGETCFQEVFNVTIFRLPRRLQNVFARCL